VFQSNTLNGFVDAAIEGGPANGPQAFPALELCMLSFFRRLLTDDKAATAIEYTLIASLIAIAAVTAISTVGGRTL
jgi:pilus assembly protein Flp/PilA